MLLARELMTEMPATIRPTTTVRSAIEKLQVLDVRHLPVVNEERELVGMISDRDLRSLALPLVGGNALDATVASLMSSDVLSVEADDDATDVVELMLENKIGAVPVTDADGTLVGIISYIDILRAMPLEAYAD